MKFIRAALLAGVLPAAAFAATGIKNSKHDLSSASANTVKATAETQTCKFCHTPHTGLGSGIVPLLNKTGGTKGFTTTATSAGTALPTSLSGVSNVCLGCHDGTVAIGAVQNGGPIAMSTVGGFVDAAGKLQGTSFAYLGGTDLSNSHPVGIPYSGMTGSSAATAGYNAASGASVTDGTSTVQLFGSAGAYKIECASCHDVHNEKGNTNLLMVNNAGSALCFTCHKK